MGVLPGHMLQLVSDIVDLWYRMDSILMAEVLQSSPAFTTSKRTSHLTNPNDFKLIERQGRFLPQWTFLKDHV